MSTMVGDDVELVCPDFDANKYTRNPVADDGVHCIATYWLYRDAFTCRCGRYFTKMEAKRLKVAQVQ